MTPTEIKLLEGRELDAAVAERVMGYRWWRSSKINRANLWSPSEQGWQDELGWVLARPQDGDFVDATISPHYSTDHNAAAAVLAEIEKRGLSMELMDVLWETSGWDGLDRLDIGWICLRLSPERVCRAALLAVGEG